jgi:hypothetical protein
MAPPALGLRSKLTSRTAHGSLTMVPLIIRKFMNPSTEDGQAISREAKAANASGEMVVGFAMLGCLLAGGVGIMKAQEMTSGLDVWLCLLGSVTAFGIVFYIFLGRH